MIDLCKFDEFTTKANLEGRIWTESPAGSVYLCGDGRRLWKKGIYKNALQKERDMSYMQSLIHKNSTYFTSKPPDRCRSAF